MIPENKIIDFVEGRLTKAEAAEIEQALLKSPALREQVEAYKTIAKDLDEFPEYHPTERLTDGFYNFLQAEQGKATSKAMPLWKRYQPLLQIAAGIALFVLGIWFGNSLNNQQSLQITKIEEDLKATQSVMLEMLKKESASQRIKAVNYSYDLETSDQKIIDALIQTMNFDANTNVRLHAAEALARFGEEAKVREAFLLSLANQENPEMQIMVINILVNLNEQRAVGEMLKLLEQDSLIDPVKNSVQNGLEVLL